MKSNLCFLDRIIFFVIVIVSSLVIDAHSEVGFDALHGSDLGMGIGARAIGLGGAFVSIADDASATFWNPAGLTSIRCNQFLVSADLPDGFSASSVVYKPTFFELESVNLTIGLSLINRLRIKGASGDDTWSGHPSYILDLGMIEVEEDFSGSVNSKTYDKRLSLSFVHPQYTNLSIGLNLIHVY